MEAVAKIAALGLVMYLSDGWNVFDFVVVLLSIVDWVATAAAMVAGGAGANPTLIRALRLVRIVRVLRTFRLLKSARSPLSDRSLKALGGPGACPTAHNIT